MTRAGVITRILWRLVFLAIFGGILYAIGLVNWSEAERSFRVDKR